MKIANYCMVFLALMAGAMVQPAMAAANIRTVADLVENIRPAGVPTNYVVTPAGLFHPSCVVKIENDDYVTAEGDIRHIDGSVTKSKVCAHPRFNFSGQLLSSDDMSSAEEVAQTMAGTAQTSNVAAAKMTGNLVVPQAPSAKSGQILFFFASLQQINYITSLYPVLEWNNYNNSAWTMTNWNCCKSGTVWRGDSITVSHPHGIRYSMTGTNCSRGVCNDWQLISTDNKTGQQTTFNTSSFGQRFNYFSNAAMNQIGVTSCNQYPANGSINFTNVHFYSVTGADITPNVWSDYTTGAAPRCNYRVTSSPNRATISFNAGQ